MNPFRSLRFVLILAFALAGFVQRCYAQVYYVTNNPVVQQPIPGFTPGSFTPINAFNMLSADGTTANNIISTPAGRAQSPTFLTPDLANNRAFYYETHGDIGIKSINFTNGSVTSAIPLAATGTLKQLCYDAQNDYIYYLTSGSILVKVKPDGSGSTIIGSTIVGSNYGFVQLFTLDIPNNRAFLYGDLGGEGVSIINLGTGAVISHIFLQQSSSNVFAMGYDPQTDKLYLANNAAVYRMNTNGTNITVIKPIASNGISFPNLGTFDFGHGMLYLYSSSTLYTIDLNHSTAPITTFTPAGTVTGMSALAPPVVTTTAPVNNGSMPQVTVAGFIQSSDAPVTEFGVVFSETNPLPTLLNSTKFVIGNNPTSNFTSGPFFRNVSMLSTPFKPATTYYIRAYAISSVGLSYGQMLSFTTLSDDIKISDIKLSTGSLTPAYSKSVSSYTVSVPYATNAITVTPIAEDPNPNTYYLAINDNYIDLGSTVGAIDLQTGNNTVRIDANAPDGNIKTISVNVIRNKIPQTVTFPAIGTNVATYGDADITPPGASASSGFDVSLSSSNTNVATIVSGKIHIVGAGTTNITALQAGNDSIAAASTTQQLTINKKAITVTANAANKIYGAADPALTYAFNTPLIGSDSFAGTLGRAAGENAGDYAIGQGSLALNDNYALTFTGANLTIKPKPIKITSGWNKTYGAPDPAFNFLLIPNPLINGDTFSGALSREPGEDAGNHAVTLGTLTAGNNYTITVTGNLFIIHKIIKVTARAQNKTYGDADPELTYTSDALVSGDSFTGTLKRNAGENAGTYTINQGTLTPGSNYTVTYTAASLKIAKKTINVIAGVQTKTYGDADPALTYTNDPLAGADAFTGSLTRVSGENAGAYAISQGSLGLSSNYTLNFTPAQLLINKALLKVKADDQTRKFNQPDPALTFSYAGFVNGEGPAVLSSLPVVVNMGGPGSPAGKYPIFVSGGSADNYTFAYTYGTMTIIPASTEATLSLALGSGGSLTPIAGSSDFNYETTVKYNVNSVTVIPTTADADATIKINGVSASSGLATSVPLDSAGITNILVVCTAADGTTVKTYAIAVKREFSPADATLASLTLSDNYTIGPGFAASITAYTANVFNTTTGITIKASPTNPGASITINGTLLNPVNPTVDLALAVGPNPVKIVVRSADGTVTKTYTLNIARTPGPGSGIADIGIAINPSSTISKLNSGPAQVNYFTSVSTGTTSITITPTPVDANAIVSIQGIVTPGGQASAPIALTGDTTLINIISTAQNGIVKTHLLTVVKQGSGNADMHFTINPNTSITKLTNGPAQVNYLTAVTYGVTSMTVTATADDANARVAIQGIITPRGHASAPIALTGDTTLIRMTSTAENGTVKTYSLNVVKQASGNTNLAFAITPSSTITQLAGSATQANYITSVAPATPSIMVTATPVDANARVSIQGIPTPGGQASAPIALTRDTTPVNMVVTAQNGTVKTFVLTVVKQGSGNADIHFTINPATTITKLTSGPAQVNYVTSVTSGTASMMVTATSVDENARVTIEGVQTPRGQASAPIALTGDTTLIHINATAQNGTVKTHLLTVLKQGSANADITLAINPNSTITKLTSGPAQVNYFTSLAPGISSMTVTATSVDANARVAIQGVVTPRGQASAPIALTGDTTRINIISTAQNGMIKTHLLTVVKQGSGNADIHFTINPATPITKLTSGPAQVNYLTTVNAAATSIIITPTSVDENARVAVQGVITPRAQASAPIALTGDTTLINLVSTAQNGIIKTYSLAVIKPKAAKLGDANNNAQQAIVVDVPKQNVLDATAKELTIYPNPFVDEVKIDLKGYNATQAGAVVTTMFGKTVYNKTLQVADGKMQLNLSNLSQGVYIINITINGERKGYRIFKN